MRSAGPIRVMVVDDSVVIRRLLTHALGEDPALEVVGSAASAEMALGKMDALRPEVLTLDIEMPGMGGLALLPLLRERYPRVRVILFSTQAGAVDALLHGASDWLAKPLGDASLGAALAAVKRDLTAKIKGLFPAPAPMARVPAPVAVARGYGGAREVLAVGVSTGGPTALATLIAGLPRDFSLPVVVVQHMPPVFTGLLADRISAQTGFDMVEAQDGMVLEPGRAYLAPGDYHMRVVREGTRVRVRLDQGAMECSCRPAVDVLFRSVATTFGGSAIVTVLTGMGQDGLKGAGDLKRAGAYVIAQDEATSVVWGMPGAVVQAGLADRVLPIALVAEEVNRQTRRLAQ